MPMIPRAPATPAPMAAVGKGRGMAPAVVVWLAAGVVLGLFSRELVPNSEVVKVLVMGMVMVMVGLSVILGVVAPGVVTLVKGAPGVVGDGPVPVGTAGAPCLPWFSKYVCTGGGSDLNQGSVMPALNSDAMMDDTAGWLVKAMLRSEVGRAVSKTRRRSPCFTPGGGVVAGGPGGGFMSMPGIFSMVAAMASTAKASRATSLKCMVFGDFGSMSVRFPAVGAENKREVGNGWKIWSFASWIFISCGGASRVGSAVKVKGQSLTGEAKRGWTKSI
ncbi:hypothetical protein BKA80DRAFT_267857 [Phyllosticta citrichinensis]